MDFKTIMENWRSFLNELNNTGMINIATRDGGDATRYWPTPRSMYPQRGFLAHNWRTQYEIEDGTIQLLGIADDGSIVWSIVPFDRQRKAKYGQYYMVIQFKNWNEIITAPGASTREKTLALVKNIKGVSDELKIHCTCPSFKYHYNYVTDKVHDSAIVSQPNPAKKRNPKNEGIACKHVRRMIKHLPNWYSDIETKVKKMEDQLGIGQQNRGKNKEEGPETEL